MTYENAVILVTIFSIVAGFKFFLDMLETFGSVCRFIADKELPWHTRLFFVFMTFVIMGSMAFIGLAIVTYLFGR